jgi:pyruvate formate lyase activating enzyme
MSQFEFARSILRAARQAGLHTCLETCGIAPAERWREIVPLVDLFLWDLKHTDPAEHQRLTGASLETVLENLRQVDTAGGRTRLRCVLLAGINLDREHLDGVARVADGLQHCEGIDLLPYHALGQAKRESLGLAPKEVDWTPDQAEVARACEYLRNRCRVPVAVP